MRDVPGCGRQPPDRATLYQTGLSPSQTLTITAGDITEVLLQVDVCPDLDFVYVPLILQAARP